MAILTGMINIIIGEKLCDWQFLTENVWGFDKLAGRGIGVHARLRRGTLPATLRADRRRATHAAVAAAAASSGAAARRRVVEMQQRLKGNAGLL